MVLNAAHPQGRSSWRAVVWLALAALMLLPVFAQAFIDEMAWSPFDFAFFGALLLGAGMTYEVAARKAGSPAYLAGAGVAVAAAFFLVLVNGAVGIIGTEDNGANLMYGGVLAIGIIGAVVARFQPAGMARALIATALAQAVVALVAVIGGLGSSTDPDWPADIIGVTAIFVVLWSISAWLFWKAAERQNFRA